MTMKLFFIVLFGFASIQSVAADPAGSQHARSKRIEKGHPIYIQLKKHYTPEEIAHYRARVDKFLSDNKARGNLPNAVEDVLKYANFIETHKIKGALAEVVQKHKPLIKIKVLTTVARDGQDTVDYSWSMFLPRNDALKDVTGLIVFAMRNLIDNRLIHKSFDLIKTDAMLSFFFMKQGDDEDGFSIMMNNDSQSFDQLLPLHTDNGAPYDDHKLSIAIKKEKEIERTIHFSTAANRATIGWLAKMVRKQEDMSAINSTSSVSSSSFGPVTYSWGQHGWMLRNYIEANFKRQKEASAVFDESHQNEHINPIHKHSDGFYYVDLGLEGLIPGSSVLLKLEKIDQEQEFSFVKWEHVTSDGINGELLKLLPRPKWDIPTANKNLQESDFSYNAENIYGRNRARFNAALNCVDDAQGISWLKSQLDLQIKTAVINKAHVEVSWYSSTNEFTYLLPLYFNDKIVLVAAFRLVDENPQQKFALQAVLIPAWGYNNARVLGAPKSEWMRHYARNYNDDNESLEKAQHMAGGKSHKPQAHEKEKGSNQSTPSFYDDEETSDEAQDVADDRRFRQQRQGRGRGHYKKRF